MEVLHPFSPVSDYVFVEGEVSREKGRLKFKFNMRDPDKIVLDTLHAGTWHSWDRADELWKSTCFEAFFGEVGSKSYWELNLSPAKQQWNLYFFDDYRLPQPPRQSKEFHLIEILVTDSSLECVLESKTDFGALEVSLAAVIRTPAGTSYRALKHSGDKPDFHDRSSFVLKA
jgi:hypothetical protein